MHSAEAARDLGIWGFEIYYFALWVQKQKHKMVTGDKTLASVGVIQYQPG